MIFYLTFGQAHPLVDGWIEVEASSYSAARLKAFEILGTKWACLYDKLEFEPKYFPTGKFGNILK